MKTRFVILPPVVSQIISGDDELIDPDLVRFDPYHDYPAKLPNGKVIKGRVSKIDGQLVIDIDLDFEKFDATGHFTMNGVRMVKAAMYAELADVHVQARAPRLLS